MTIALSIMAAVFVMSIALGLLARRGHAMTLEQWSVAGGGFGSVFVFLLMAGELYTTFTFLGGSGWAYGKGAPAMYILCYPALAYSLSYFLLPAIWRASQGRGFVSQADFFIARYGSRTLGVIVALVGVAALIPYLVLQFKGLGIIVAEASYGRVSPATGIWAGAVALIVYVVVSGVRGSAWTAALKDAMILVVVVAMGLYLPYHWYGGIGPMFDAIDKARPDFLTLGGTGRSTSWFISTVLLTSIGVYTWPQFFGGVYTAKSDDVFRKNAVVLPIYQLVVLFVFFVGFAATLKVPGLVGADGDLSLFRIAKLTFSPWAIGLIGAAGLLTALVPGSMLLISAATILAKNVYRELVPSASERRVAFVARAMVPVLTLLSVILTLHGGSAIVALLLMGYNVVTQLFPALILSLGKSPKIGTSAALAGIVAGEVTVAAISLSGASLATLLPGWPPVITELNVGVVALVVNVVAILLVTLATRGRAPVTTVTRSGGAGNESEVASSVSPIA
jgi:SSS family solute:Na+ symporter